MTTQTTPQKSSESAPISKQTAPSPKPKLDRLASIIQHAEKQTDNFQYSNELRAELQLKKFTKEELEDLAKRFEASGIDTRIKNEARTVILEQTKEERQSLATSINPLEWKPQTQRNVAAAVLGGGLLLYLAAKMSSGAAKVVRKIRNTALVLVGGAAVLIGGYVGFQAWKNWGEMQKQVVQVKELMEKVGKATEEQKIVLEKELAKAKENLEEMTKRAQEAKNVVQQNVPSNVDDIQNATPTIEAARAIKNNLLASGLLLLHGDLNKKEKGTEEITNKENLQGILMNNGLNNIPLADLKLAYTDAQTFDGIVQKLKITETQKQALHFVCKVVDSLMKKNHTITTNGNWSDLLQELGGTAMHLGKFTELLSAKDFLNNPTAFGEVLEELSNESISGSEEIESKSIENIQHLSKELQGKEATFIATCITQKGVPLNADVTNMFQNSADTEKFRTGVTALQEWFKTDTKWQQYLKEFAHDEAFKEKLQFDSIDISTAIQLYLILSKVRNKNGTYPTMKETPVYLCFPLQMQVLRMLHKADPNSAQKLKFRLFFKGLDTATEATIGLAEGIDLPPAAKEIFAKAGNLVWQTAQNQATKKVNSGWNALVEFGKSKTGIATGSTISIGGLIAATFQDELFKQYPQMAQEIGGALDAEKIKFVSQKYNLSAEAMQNLREIARYSSDNINNLVKLAEGKLDFIVPKIVLKARKYEIFNKVCHKIFGERSSKIYSKMFPGTATFTRGDLLPYRWWNKIERWKEAKSFASEVRHQRNINPIQKTTEEAAKVTQAADTITVKSRLIDSPEWGPILKGMNKGVSIDDVDSLLELAKEAKIIDLDSSTLALIRDSKQAKAIIAGAIETTDVSEVTRALKAAKNAAKWRAVGNVAGAAGDVFGIYMAVEDWKMNDLKIKETKNSALKELYGSAQTVNIVEGGASATGLCIGGYAFVSGLYAGEGLLASAGAVGGTIMLPIALAVGTYGYAHKKLEGVSEDWLREQADWAKKSSGELLKKQEELGPGQISFWQNLSTGNSRIENFYHWSTMSNDEFKKWESAALSSPETANGGSRYLITRAYIAKMTELPPNQGESDQNYENRFAEFQRLQIGFIGEATNGMFGDTLNVVYRNAHTHAELVILSKELQNQKQSHIVKIERINDKGNVIEKYFDISKYSEFTNQNDRTSDGISALDVIFAYQKQKKSKILTQVQIMEKLKNQNDPATITNDEILQNLLLDEVRYDITLCDKKMLNADLSGWEWTGGEQKNLSIARFAMQIGLRDLLRSESKKIRETTNIQASDFDNSIQKIRSFLQKNPDKFEKIGTDEYYESLIGPADNPEKLVDYRWISKNLDVRK